MDDTFERRYQAISSRDRRYDGQFYTAVTSTGIYCRPSCPARTPRPDHVLFFVTAAAAQAAGFRACRRCRPEASPGSPAWDTRADQVARALRMINDGAVDSLGVAGLAHRLAVSERHLHRQMVAEVGVGPLALARMRRAQTAKLLLEASDLSITRIAFASGYASIRQFNDSIRAAFGCTPSKLRRTSSATNATGEIVVRLALRHPYAMPELASYLKARAVSGIEETDGEVYRRSLRLGHGSAVVSIVTTEPTNSVVVRLQLDELKDLAAAVQRCRRMLDLDADPVAIDRGLGADPVLAPLVARRPGLRVPGHADGFELAVRAVLGQQVSVQGARTLLGRVVARFGKPLDAAAGSVTHLFPDPETLAGADLDGLGITGQRVRAIHALAQAVREGSVDLTHGTDRDATWDALVALPGIGPWTADYIAMRALSDPDAIPLGDLGLRRAWAALDSNSETLPVRAERWRPWRAYAAMHLWCSEQDAPPPGSSN